MLRRTGVAIAMAAAFTALPSLAYAQAEISGQAAATGKDVSKAISVSQRQLDAADGDSANFLHSNMNYAQTRDYPAFDNIAHYLVGL